MQAPDSSEDRRTGPCRWILFAVLVGFVGLAYHAKRGTALDHAVLGWMVEHRNAGLHRGDRDHQRR